jgi:hypothetical protein
MAGRFRKHPDACFEFLTSSRVDSTNNVAEQATRFVVIYRHVTQGTGSVNGRRASERLGTVIAIWALQGRSAFTLILQAAQAYFDDGPRLLSARLLPDPSRRTSIGSIS